MYMYLIGNETSVRYLINYLLSYVLMRLISVRDVMNFSYVSIAFS